MKKATKKDVLYALEHGQEKLIKTIIIGDRTPDHYSLSKSGFDVPASIAREVLSDPHITEADSGLFPGMSQSFEWKEVA